MLNAMAVTVLMGLVGGGAMARVETADGWYQLEEGFGESGESVAVVVAEGGTLAFSTSAGESSPAPKGTVQPGLSQEELARWRRLDCEEVRGRYLQRVLEIHGVNVFALEPRLLAAWTHQRPHSWMATGISVWSEPALAPLYGEPPIPAGALSYDFTLQNLAQDLLRCDNGLAGPQPPERESAVVPPARATAPPATAAVTQT